MSQQGRNVAVSKIEADEVYTVPEVAELLKTSVRTVQRWVRDGRLPSLKIGGLRRVTGAAIKQFLAQMEVKARASK
jgi:excisionase family DNA binding protein